MTTTIDSPDVTSRRGPWETIRPGAVRTCDTTGLPVCLTAQRFIKLHAVVAVVFLLSAASARSCSRSRAGRPCTC